MQIIGSKSVFIEDGWFEDFGEGVALVGRRCLSCGKVSFPAKPACPECFTGEQRKIPLSRRGTLHTFTVSYMGPPGIDKPYAIGFVDLPEGIRLFSLLTGCEPFHEVLEVGMEMEMVVEPVLRDGEGNPIVGYKFRPVRRGEKR
jgi:uncharacterized OB-fold protein